MIGNTGSLGEQEKIYSWIEQLSFYEGKEAKFKVEEMRFSSFPNTMEFVEWEFAEPLDAQPLR